MRAKRKRASSKTKSLKPEGGVVETIAPSINENLHSVNYRRWNFHLAFLIARQKKGRQQEIHFPQSTLTIDLPPVVQAHYL